MDLPNEYLQLVRIPMQQIVVLANNESIDISLIKHGILFVFAEWSGAAQKSFRVLNDALGELMNIHNSIVLYLADSDNLTTQLFMQSVADVPSGRGETYWIHEGRIVGRLVSCAIEASQTIRQLTKQTFEV